MDKIDSKDRSDRMVGAKKIGESRKVKIELNEDIVLRILALKQTIGETYSDILNRVLPRIGKGSTGIKKSKVNL